ncbi:hypothetical protein cypCar_00016347 [Cyprinus carpio]|nr:hypothetical protein cypCar_00016347 [Cyprinus carpio]
MDQIHSSFNKLMSELNKPGAPYVLSLANRLYGEQSYQFVEKFLNDAKRYYEAGLEEVDFKKKPDAVRVDINKWVEKNTQGKIKDLLPQGTIDPLTRLVLVNAIYFKGNWLVKFPKEATRDGQFNLNKYRTKPVKMMYQESKFPLAFIPEMNSQVLELPYVGKNLSMLIILPNEIEDETTGLQKLEKALTYEKLMEWTKPSKMRQQVVNVSLPRFKMEQTYDNMKSLLISMGMEDVFDERKVNLSGMSPSNDLVVTKVVHKAFIELVKMERLSAANTQFSLNLFKKISGGNASKNVFYSPISISSALAMVSLGAKGNTAAQMFKLEKALTYEKLMEWTKPSKMLQEEVEVSLPRFKMEITYDMVQFLIRMGMVDVFSLQKVNLSGMSPNNDLVVSELEKMERLSAANTQFSLNLFKKISGGNASGNVFYSPISISSALAMVSLGAKGNTAAQMFQVLGFNNPAKPDAATPAPYQQAQKPQIACGVKGQHELPMMQQTQKSEIPAELKKSPAQLTSGQKTEDQIHSSFNKLMSELNKPGAPYVLSLANRLYGEQSYQFVEKFLNDAKIYYKAGLEEVDFKKKSEAVRLDINKWVEKNTQEKIKDLLPQGSIGEMTKLVLVNAIYFKGNWLVKFPKEATRDGQFKLNKVLELPYVGKNLSMMIILPSEIEDETTGLQKLEKALTYEKLMEWTKPSKMLQEQVQVSLPRFKMEETYDNIKSFLISMGMEDVFDERKVNLSGMSPNNDLVVTKVIHKAFVEVNEEGTEAAAATGVIIAGFSMPLPPKTFIADHPFLFFIRHNPSNSILFYGRFCSP